ncbi:phospholipid scramblase 3-like [Mytilus galloprovincialis]|uniref:phospholipid scramblase 1-like n=1 Tax=Mytilus trossulus TaxID=6551 RepID=UPI003006323B
MIVPEEVQRNEHRRQSLVLDRVARSSVIYTQPRQSVVSNMSGDSRTPTDVLLEMKNRRMTLGSDRRMSMRPRRKSVNPKIDPPPGMECLDGKRFVYARQQMDSDLLAGCGAPNTYKVWDENEEELFYALEESSCICRWACGPNRQFRLEFFSPQDDLVFALHRTCCRCDWCCCLDCFMCVHKTYVVDCLGRTLGSVKQKFTWMCKERFDILDGDGNVVALIKGPNCVCRCSTEASFKIYDKTGEDVIGSINKKWEGERDDNLNVDHEYFEIHFPEKMDNIDKMLVLGGAFLINYMYFEMS